MTRKAVQPSKASIALVLLVSFTMLSGILVPSATMVAGAKYKDFKVLKHLSGTKSGEFVSWSPDGKYIVSQTSSTQQSDFSFRYWRTQKGWDWVDVKTEHTGVIWSFDWSPDSSHLATIYRSLIIFDITNDWKASDPLNMPGNQMARSVGYNPAGNRVAVGTELGQVVIVNTNTMTIEKTFNATDRWIERVVYSPNGKLLAVSDVAGKIFIYDTDTWKAKWTLSSHTQDVKGLAFRPDGTELMSTSFDSNIYLWDMTDGSFIKKVGGHGVDIAVFDVKWSSAANLVITGGSQDICVWDGTTYDLLQKIMTGHSGNDANANTLSWDPKGERFVSSGSYGIDVWSQNVPTSTDPLSQLTSYLCGLVLLVIIVGLGGYAAYQYYQRKKLETDEEEGGPEEEEEPEEEEKASEEEEKDEEDEDDDEDEEEDGSDDEDDEERRQRRKERRRGQRKKGW
jgi:WD40 repeat protein